jgi:Cation transport ATPase
MAVNALVVGEIAFLLNARAIAGPALTRRGVAGSRPVWISIALMAAFQLAFTYAPPMQALFGTTAIGAADWALLAGLGAAVFLVVEAEKALGRRFWLRTA